MARNIIKTEQPVVLEGFQAVMKPSKFGYSLATTVGSEMVEQLEADHNSAMNNMNNNGGSNSGY